MSDNIKVVVKVRPLISREIEDKLSYRWRVKNNTLWQLDQNGRETEACFTFDKVYDKETKTQEVYDDIAKPIVEAAIAGFNGTIFAYGQTSSGKTYTMTGTEESPGITPLAVLNLFDTIKTKTDRDFLVRVSYIEIYNETLKDLLNVEKKNIKIHDTLQGVKVDCSERVTGSPEDVLAAMKEGEANRQTGATNMNEESSRSHSIFQITIESREHIDGEDDKELGCVNVSQLNLVDLAGSERAGQTGATGLRFKEGTHINKSLSSLALVIKQLSEDPNKYANYRDSKLTRILQNSLGGNAKTSIICAITPASVEETVSTLQFATRAKFIKNKPEVNAVATNATMIQSLTKQLSKLQSELAAKRNLEVMLESRKNVEQELQNRIATLQKMILNGFGQYSTLQLSARRKLAAPRRQTISTLHHVQEEPVVKTNIPKFCTPSLKYNPLNIPAPMEFAPIQPPGGGKLATVPEEARVVTPPPRGNNADKKVGFQDDIIEITSDEDSLTETRCSPYHKCYGSSKTPPCILRKNAKQAERNLQDIVELTEREKIYTPSVVELMEKLEQNTCIISQLQEEVQTLKEKTKEKDSKIEELTVKVSSSEVLVNSISTAKLDLELKCKEKDTKLTDFEVSYETLEKKAKTREQELLSLLEEQTRGNSRESIGKPKKMENEMMNFLDMSKDMTLVHSDTDSSTHDDGAVHLRDLVHNIQEELATKTQTIIDLEADIYKQKQQIESLETSSHKLQSTINEFKSKLAEIETENSYLKGTIDNLNSTIENQKRNLESADRDIESYNSTIQELQIQLSKKEILSNIKVNDSLIDSMIANEQKCIANNDNIKNIIHSLQVLIENKNREIADLKLTIDENNENCVDQVTLKEQLEIKENRILSLVEEAETLKHQLNVNLNEISKLLDVEKDLTSRLTTMQEENKTLQQQNIENAQKIVNLQKITTESDNRMEKLQCDLESLTCKVAEKELHEQNITSKNEELSKQIVDMTNKINDLEKDLSEKKLENKQLTQTVADKELSEQNVLGENQELSKKIEDMTQKINSLECDLQEKVEAIALANGKDEEMTRKMYSLECDLREKDVMIAKANCRDEEIQNNLAKAKSILFKIQDIALKLIGAKEDLPEYIEDIGVALEIMNTKVIKIDTFATQSLQTISELEEKCFSISRKINSLERDLREKDEMIALANGRDKEIQNNFEKAKSILFKIQDIALKLKGAKEDLPEYIDDIGVALEIMNTKVINIDISATQSLQTISELEEKCSSISRKINSLERDLREKDEVIALANDRDKEIQNNLAKAKSILFKIQDIAIKLRGAKEDLPEYIEDIGVALEIMDTKVINIDNSATQSLQTITELEEKCSSISSRYSELKAEEEQLNNQLTVETETLTEKTLCLIEDLNKTRTELQNKEQDIINLQEKLDNSLSICNDVERKSQEHFNKSFYVLRKLHNIAFKLNRGIETLPDAVDNYDALFELFDCKLNVLDSYVIHILQIANDMQEKLMEITNDKETDIANFESQIEKINSDMAIQTLQVSQRTLHLIEELKKCRVEIEAKEQQILALEIELNEVQESNKNLRNGMISKDNSITSLHEKLSAVHTELETLRNMNMSVDKLEETLNAKYIQIKHLEDQLASGVDSLEDKYRDVTNGLGEAIQKRDMLLAEILKKAGRVARQCGIDNSEIGESYDEDVYERVVVILDKIGMSVALLKTENDVERYDIEKTLTMAKEEIEKLTAMNVKLTNGHEDIRNKNNELLLELEETKKLNIDLLSSKEILEQLKLELSIKSNEITSTERKVTGLKEQFKNYEQIMKGQMSELAAENEKLKKLQKRESLSEFSENLTKPISDLAVKSKVSNSPQSLLTICCNKIIDAIHHQIPTLPDTHTYTHNTTCSTTTSSSKISISTENVETQTKRCDCDKLALKLTEAEEENAKLVEDLEKATKENLDVIDLLKDMQATNDYLLEEREEVKKEIQLLVEPAMELQKKIVNHRTNLSTLTATTFAENKLLNSQLKVLKHHHTRYIHVCQRDLPAFKTQLSELMTLLKESNFNDRQNTSFKRYSLPDVLDNSTSTSAFKNESTLDGDLLMMDTNLTLTTVDNTLVGPDQTCLDVTQVNFDANETTCQVNDISKIIDPYILYSQMETLTTDNHKLSEQIEALQQENGKLKEEVLALVRQPTTYKDAENSPIKTNGVNNDIFKDVKEKSVCESCQQINEELLALEKTLSSKLKQLSIELEVIKSEKDSIQEKYNNLILEMPSTEALLRKLSNIEKDNMLKSQEINKLASDVNKKNKLIKELQDENETLSVEVMDNISEADALKKELDELQVTNKNLTEKVKGLELLAKEYNAKSSDDNTCSHCAIKDEMILSLRLEQSKLTRSLSDSETSSRHNKICTLQHELHASKEDCKKITEEVATIKNHLERSNVSVCQAMDLDESMGDSSLYTISDDLANGRKNSENDTQNLYQNDKLDCFNFYVDIVRSENEMLNDNVKIIDIMKAFYRNLVAKHGDEVENLMNKLKDMEESKTRLQTQLSGVNTENSKIRETLHDSQNKIKTFTKVLDGVKSNINFITEEMSKIIDVDKNSTLVMLFKENLLKVLDSEFSLSCGNIFESIIDSIINKHQKDLSDIMERYSKLQNHVEGVVQELNSVNENLTQIKSQLSDKENEYNLLKAQKEKVHEISNAVTLDIIKKEQELKDVLNNGYQKLLELNLIDSYNVEVTLSLTENLRVIFESVINKNNITNIKRLHTYNIAKNDTNTEQLIIEINSLKEILEEKEKFVSSLQERLSKNEKDLQEQKIFHEEIYEKTLKDNKTHLEKIDLLTNELAALKEELLEKKKKYMDSEKLKSEELLSQSSSEQTNATKDCGSCSEIFTKLECCIQDYSNLKTLYEMTTKEKETIAAELDKAQEIIAKNKVELDNMTSDILVLRESVNDNVSIIQSLTAEAKSMMEQNIQLKKQFENKSLEVSRLEMNIKTHEKTAQIQSKMITRLQKQKEDDDNLAKEKDRQLDDLTQKCTVLQSECERMKNDLKAARDELENLKIKKDSLEAKVADLEMDLMQDGHKRRQSIDAIAEASRRRRQSLHDTKRAFAEEFDANKIEEVFESRVKPDDLFMDIDADNSDRSTPVRLSRERDSFPRNENEDNSRPSSVTQTRRRRQSIHDQRRSMSRRTPSPDIPIGSSEKPNNVSAGDNNSLDVIQLREQLATTQRELEELKEKYRELDEECEICAQYLQERDEQCRKLKKEKVSLELQVTELNEKLKINPNQCLVKPTFAHAAVNTDEDWANLHSVVVDRMSFDAEVEKNKKLSRTIEELRCNKQELKNTIAKMQKALERNAASMHSRELDAAKSELASCKRELADLQERYRELDEECETCAQYLRERDEQCRKLREAKNALEKKLEELQGDVSNLTASARRKRQSAHDQNRSPQTHAHRADKQTETSDDLLSYLVERDDNALRATSAHQELQRVQMTLERVLREKAVLENQLTAMPTINPTLYVATGSAIVQNQQLTDIMKENQKLKRMNAKLISICKKRGKAHDSNRENEEPSELG